MAITAAAAAPISSTGPLFLKPFPCFSSSFPTINPSKCPTRKGGGGRHALVVRSSSPSPFRNGSAPETDCPVPSEQQPVNEYQTLASSLPFAWAAADLHLYSSRLLAIGASFSFFVGLPVSWFGVVSPERDALRCAIAAVSAGILAVTFAVLRIYLGWAYVGNRLLSATVEYEETGWYDGQIWVKTPEVLARDRLLGSFSVKPVLNRVKLTLVGLALSLFACILLFVNLESPKDKRTTFPDTGGRSIPGVYSDASARSFEPDAFCGSEPEPDLS
ncbi:hypothetical protein H6P81_000205 [Aristolochia fimbriata]|uniref:DUF1230 family protein n=1 Tax=Aristolochia fimbriata TaxID=158543 RepID=A0AAV7F6S5_ARIFI|nr:hypothetical protein H6P81_000205 [Aristolochia fimbriata]